MRFKSSRAAALAFAALLVLTPPVAAAQSVPDPATVAAEQAARQAAALAPFSGGWAKHGYHLDVQLDGTAVAGWRTYQWCKDPGVKPPCDSFRGNEIVEGGYARMAFLSVEDQTAIGIMIEHPLVPAGTTRPVRLTLRPDGLAVLSWGDVASVSPSEQRPIDGTVLCRPDAWQTVWCGA